MLWRHGRTEWNASSRFQGTTDVPLDAVGVAQAERAARDLSSLGPDRIVASDLDRARTTAQALADLVGLDVATDADLRETYAGDWQGLVREEIVARDRERYHAWIGGADVRPGGGETRTEVGLRVQLAVERHLAHVGDGGVLVVATHGGAARAGMGRMLGLPVEHWAVLGGLVNCAWSVLEEGREGGWRLVEHNARSLPEELVVDAL